MLGSLLLTLTTRIIRSFHIFKQLQILQNISLLETIIRHSIILLRKTQQMVGFTLFPPLKEKFSINWRFCFLTEYKGFRTRVFVEEIKNKWDACILIYHHCLNKHGLFRKHQTLITLIWPLSIHLRQCLILSYVCKSGYTDIFIIEFLSRQYSNIRLFVSKPWMVVVKHKKSW